MAALILDADLEKDLRDQRAAWGADRFDEVWDGVYRITPVPNDEHQGLVIELASILQQEIGWKGKGVVRTGVNVSDRDDEWRRNYRVPVVAVLMNGGLARRCGAYWLGGPDFVIEIVSTGDETREKISFYSKIGVRELLLIDRDPWLVELFRQRDNQLVSVGRSDLAGTSLLSSEVLPFTFQLVPDPERPRISVTATETNRAWRI